MYIGEALLSISKGQVYNAQAVLFLKRAYVLRR